MRTSPRPWRARCHCARSAHSGWAGSHTKPATSSTTVWSPSSSARRRPCSARALPRSVATARSTRALSTSPTILYILVSGNAPVRGDVYDIDPGTGSFETEVVTAVAGAGPYTLTLASSTVNAHAGGANIVSARLRETGYMPFYAPVASNATNPSQLAVGGGVGNGTAIFESTDNGQTFTALHNTGATATTGVTAIAYGGFAAGVAKPNVIYVGDQSGQLFVRTDTGATLDPVAYGPNA